MRRGNLSYLLGAEASDFENLRVLHSNAPLLSYQKLYSMLGQFTSFLCDMRLAYYSAQELQNFHW